MSHPLLLLCCCGCINCKRLSPCADQPSILELSIILQGLQLDLLQWDDVLGVVLLLANDDAAVHKEVIEQKELTRFQLLPASFCQNTFPNQNSTCKKTTSLYSFPFLFHFTWYCKGLASRAKASLNQSNPSGICLRVHCNTIKIK